MKLNKIGVIMVALLIVLSGCASKQEEIPALDTTYVNTVDGSVRVGKDGAIPLNESELSKIQVDIFFEPACAACLVYGDNTRSVLMQEVATGETELVYHPVTFLSERTPDAVSARSAAYALAVAEYAPEHALNYFERIVSISKAPAPNENGLTPDESFINIMKELGVNEEQLQLIDEHKAEFIPLLNKSTNNFLEFKHPLQAASLGKNGEVFTPLIIANETGQMTSEAQSLDSAPQNEWGIMLQNSIDALK